VHEQLTYVFDNRSFNMLIMTNTVGFSEARTQYVIVKTMTIVRAVS
jgi:hypothetical protein